MSALQRCRFHVSDTSDAFWTKLDAANSPTWRVMASLSMLCFEHCATHILPRLVQKASEIISMHRAVLPVLVVVAMP